MCHLYVLQLVIRLACLAIVVLSSPLDDDELNEFLRTLESNEEMYVKSIKLMWLDRRSFIRRMILSIPLDWTQWMSLIRCQNSAHSMSFHFWIHLQSPLLPSLSYQLSHMIILPLRNNSKLPTNSIHWTKRLIGVAFTTLIARNVMNAWAAWMNALINDENTMISIVEQDRHSFMMRNYSRTMNSLQTCEKKVLSFHF